MRHEILGCISYSTHKPLQALMVRTAQASADSGEGFVYCPGRCNESNIYSVGIWSVLLSISTFVCHMSSSGEMPCCMYPRVVGYAQVDLLHYKLQQFSLRGCGLE